MFRALRNVYRRIVPADLRRNAALKQWDKKREQLRNTILAYYGTPVSSRGDEIEAALQFLRTNPLHVLPYPFVYNYKAENVQVLFDAPRQLPYVMFEGKRLYYKQGWSAARIKDYHNGLLQEQDPGSPHRYLSASFNVSASDTVADVGAAEGIFALSVIDRVKCVVLFETDAGWCEALKATFAPFGDKAVIIPQAVSDVHAGCVSLDAFFHDNEVDFIKMDVDGGEAAALRGADQLLRERKSLKLAVCAYHRAGDEAAFTNLLAAKGFGVEPATGVMIFYYDTSLAPPYFRRGVLRATKR